MGQSVGEHSRSALFLYQRVPLLAQTGKEGADAVVLPAGRGHEFRHSRLARADQEFVRLAAIAEVDLAATRIGALVAAVRALLA